MAFPAIIDLDSLDGKNGFLLIGNASNEYTGYSVSNAGDINGDGFDDFIVGGHQVDPNGVEGAGVAYVIFGKEGGFDAMSDFSNLDGTNGFILQGVDSRDYAGYSISAAGDINSDGFDDIIIGAFKADADGNVDSGESYVVFGKADGFSATLDLSSLDGTNGFRLDGIEPDDNAGMSVSSAGDINGDGIDDVIIGADRASPNGNGSAGQAYVVFGKTGGFVEALDLSALDGSNGFRIDGLNFGDAFGSAVRSAGDVNGDGVADIIIGARFADPGDRSAAGTAYVIFGSTSAFSSSFDLSTIDGSNGFVIEGIGSSDYAGGAVAGAGDINGDGIDDILIGAVSSEPGETSSSANNGEAYVVFGKASGFAVSIALSTLDGTNGFRIPGLASGDNLGRAVSAAGDVNGDGFNDFIISAHTADPDGVSNAGSTYVIFGNSAPFSAELDLASLDGTSGFRIDGIDIGDFAGISASGGGDINGDGYDDIIIGASTADLQAGNAYIVFGKTSRQTEGTALDDNLEGARGNDTLNGFEGNDRLNGRDGDDIMRGGAGDDQYFVSNLGDMVIELAGEGTDTVTSGVIFTLPDNVENLRLRGDATEGTGNELDNEIFSVAPGATLRGMGGNDNLRGSDFSETLFGGEGNDELNGRDGNDILIGDEGVDLLRGRNDDDTLRGGADRDTMRGGAGADTYVFFDGDFAGLTASDADRIGGFRSTEGDLIDLSAVDAITGTVEDDAFTFVGNEDFSGTAGELRWEFDGSRTMLYMDVDGDGAADHAIRLNGIVNLTEADFIL